MDYDTGMMMEGSDLNRTNQNRYEKDCQQRSDLQYIAEALYSPVYELRFLHRLYPLEYFLDYRAELPLHHVHKVFDFNQGQTADLTVFFPGGKRQFVPCADFCLLPQFLWQYHLTSFINTYYRFNLAGGIRLISCNTATHIRFFLQLILPE